MAPVRNARLVFNQHPEPNEYPVPGKITVYDPTPTIDLDTVSIPKDAVLIKVLTLSIDPVLRMTMKPNGRQKIGAPILNFGIGQILRSENPSFKSGDVVAGMLNFEEYVIKTDTSDIGIIENKENLPWSLYVGVLGWPGKSAYYAWKEYVHPKKGDIVFVTTGAGPVGSLVIQLAKLDGLKVIASAGSDEKVEFMKSIGADVAFNYKTTETSEVLAKEGPINIYWDHVGGEILDKAIDAAASQAQFILCGAISSYNSGFSAPVKNLYVAILKEITLYGYYVGTLDEKYKQEFYEVIPKMVKDGKIKYLEDVTQGLEKAGEAIFRQQKGENFGKSVVRVSD